MNLKYQIILYIFGLIITWALHIISIIRMYGADMGALIFAVGGGFIIAIIWPVSLPIWLIIAIIYKILN